MPIVHSGEGDIIEYEQIEPLRSGLSRADWTYIGGLRRRGGGALVTSEYIMLGSLSFL